MMKPMSMIAFGLLFTFAATAQGIRIGDTPGNAVESAGLELSFSDKGFLPPRMTTAARDAIANPANGLFIFNTTSRCYEGYDGVSASWVPFGCICPPPTTANAGVDQNVTCGNTTTTLAGNTPVSGTGMWTVVSGTATITTPSSPTSGVTGLAISGTAVLRWTISNGACVSDDDVTLTTCSFVCGINTLTDADGYTYNTVLIGNQCWMKENLKTGTLVAVGTMQTNNGTIEKHCQNLSSIEDASCPLGGLYQWNEMMNYTASCNGSGAPPNDKCPTPVKGICPTGWHIPSHNEWTTLEKNVGSNPDAFNYNTFDMGGKGTDEGDHLKATTSWITPNNNTNSSGFTALPGGYSYNGWFSAAGSNGSWWSATENSGAYAWYRALSYSLAQVSRNQNYKESGFAVRCVKD